MDPHKALRSALPWMILLLSWTLCAYFILPKFLEIFRDFGVALSPLTLAVHAAGRFWRGDIPSLSAPLQLTLQIVNLLAGLGLVLFAALLGRVRVVATLGWVVLALVLSVVVGSNFHPLTSMLNSLNNPRPAAPAP
ncbi:MAG: hypothetical protein ACOYN0_12150 [Phycisphaerales bacterium]